MLKMEFHRIGKRPVFWFILIVGILLALIPVIQIWPESLSKEDYAMYPMSPYVGWMHFVGETYLIYTLVFPLLASLAYSDTYAEDYNTGLLKNILTRIEKKKYLLNRFFINFFIGGLVSVFPLVINFMGVMTAFPLIENNYYFGMLVVVNGSFLPELYYEHPFLYIILRLIIIFLFGGVLASIGLAFSTIVKNRYIVLIVPLLFVTALDVLLNAFGQLSLSRIFLGNVEVGWLLFVYLSIGILGSSILYFYLGDKHETI